MVWNCQLWSSRITRVYTIWAFEKLMKLSGPHSCQQQGNFVQIFSPTNTKVQSRKTALPINMVVYVCVKPCFNLSPHLSNERNCIDDSLAASPTLPRKAGGSRLGSTMISSAGVLTRLRRMSFTFLPFESVGRAGLTSDDSVDKASEMASGPWATPEDDRSASLAAVEVWSSPMPESYRRRETPFSTSSPPEMAPLSKKTHIIMKKH